MIRFFPFPRSGPLLVTGLTTLGYFLLATSGAADWPHYRGPGYDGSVRAKGALIVPGGAPEVLWKASVGKGTSAVTVSGGRAYTMGNVGGKDSVFCLDANTGRPIWRHQSPVALDPNMFEGGPRATPTVSGELVFCVSHQGDLSALDAGSGKRLWVRHYQQDFGGRRPQWGYAGSPTVEGNLVLVDAGGAGASTVALDKNSGRVVWKSGSDEAGYASVVVATLAGRRTAIVLKAGALVGLDVKSGNEWWRWPWKTEYDVNAATPVVLGDRILISSGYNAGATLLEVTPRGVSERWRNKNLRAHINSPVIAQGYVFGIDGNTGGGNLVCLDLSNGAKRWQEKTVKGGSLIVVNGKFIVLTEKGELVVADASPAGFYPQLRARVLDPRCWVQPSFAAGRLFVKNNEGQIACLDLGAK
ncbi:MAG: PQQ-like beta-propeller repeat protein [Verrucomicrobiota bacterium]|nr:PQQ-like beta-propeller repeat protein [Verrucomicrobiota bacterium]